MGSQQFCLRWHNHQSNMLNVFDQLLQNEALVDVTLACDGLSMKAHKVVLSACSPYFQSLFVENPCQHPIVFLKDVRYADLKALVDFMYKGEVNVTQEQLNAVLKTAESLKVKGLAEVVPPGYRGRHQGSRGDVSPIPMSAASLHALGLGVSSETHGPSGSSGKEGQALPQKQQTGGSLVVVGGSQRAPSPPLSPALSPPRVPDALRRSNSPPAKRRKAKPRKRAPDNAFAIDPEDSDALDLTTGSPEMIETCMDMPDSGYDPTAAAVGSFVAAAAQQQQHHQQQHHHQQHHQMYSERGYGNTGPGSGTSDYLPRGASSAVTMQGLHVDIGEENGSQLDRGDSSSEGTTAQGSPAGMVTLRMPQLAPKGHQQAPPGTSVMATTPPPTPSTSATQASIQDAPWWSERRMRAYHCEHCKMTFESKALLYRHGCPKERVGFSCEVCGSSFPSHSRYHRHKQIHNPTRETYTCYLCNKTMVRLDHLKTHLRNVHGVYP